MLTQVHRAFICKRYLRANGNHTRLVQRPPLHPAVEPRPPPAPRRRAGPEFVLGGPSAADTAASAAVAASYLVGKGIVLFTMFYCSLNWALYRRLRRQSAGDEKESSKDKNKNTGADTANDNDAGSNKT